MSGTVLHLGSFKSSWSTGEDGQVNRAECGEGQDREKQRNLTADLASIWTWEWGCGGPGGLTKKREAFGAESPPKAEARRLEQGLDVQQEAG